MFERLFAFLFKYRPVVFDQGELALGTPWPLGLILGVGAVAAAAVVILYSRSAGSLDRRDRVVLTALRIGALAVLVFCLARPMLIISTVVPQQNFLGILVDDSRSMQIADGETPRSQWVYDQFGPEGSELLSALAERFKLRFFRFSETTTRLNDASELAFAGRQTDLGRALDAARRELAAVPLAGLVLVTDGATNSPGSMTDALMQLRASGVPVHTVGLGQPRFERDLAVERATVPQTALQGSSVAVDVTVVHRGFDGETVQLTIEDGGRILNAQEVQLSRDGEASTVRAHFVAEESGPRTIRFHVAPQDGEIVEENNTMETLIYVDDGRRRILYFEGEPRWEVKYLRRAIAEDENVEVVVLQRNADDKFSRLGVEDSLELIAGFPTTREELFRYDGLILGSIEASFFTHDQLGMIADFVSRRGGGLLALGGRHAFVQGGYTGTAVADALPVMLESGIVPDSGSFFAEVDVELTPFGRTHAAIQLAASMEASAARWNSLPAISTLNPLTAVKPGASTLLVGRAEETSDPLVVLAYQRYGRGKALAFPVQDSWLWQMHADIPLEDMTHETFWRQLLRWLVSDVDEHVSVATSSDRVERNMPVTVTSEVSDSGYLRINGAEVVATVTAPSGAVRDVPMEWTVERDGEYRTTFVPDEDGLHEIEVYAENAGTSLGFGTAHVEAGDLQTEFRDAEMNASLLERIADETGGRFYTPETVSTLPEDVSFTESGTTVHEERDLWDMPVLFLLLIALIGTEWAYRRSRGLA